VSAGERRTKWPARHGDRAHTRRLPRLRAPFVCTIASLVLALAGKADAQSGGAYELHWSTRSAGGATFASGGAYRLGASVGTPSAGQMSSGPYAVNGGFWVSESTAVLAVPPLDSPVPESFTSFGASPNPFASSTTLAFDLPATRHVELSIHSVDGRCVRHLIDAAYDPGRHFAVWNGMDDRGRAVPSGIYFVRLRAEEHQAIHRIVHVD
jgi:hypothetical protein